MSKENKQFYEFGPFRIDPDERLLLREGQPIALTPKAFETLLILIRSCERVVLKDDLMKTLWPDSFVEESNLTQNIFTLRKALGESAQDARYITTVPGRGYRFTEKVKSVPEHQDQEIVVESRSITRVVIDDPGTPDRTWLWVGLTAVVVAAMVGGGFYWKSSRQPRLAPMLSEKDSIVIADFNNTTGDVLFDDILKQGLAIQLEQSPYLRVLPDSKVRSTLKLMNRPAGERIQQDTAREVCLRNNGKAVLEGSIGSVGTHYLIGLRAWECQSGETLASASNEAANRDGILAGLGYVGNRLREKLGESLTSVAKYNKPLEQATTSSLEALKIYTQGQMAMSKGDQSAGVAYFNRAIELDPNFARCYASLGSAYHNLHQSAHSIESYKKAYGLRDRVSDRERYYIEANYYSHVTGEADKSIQTYREWIQNYPQDMVPHFNLSVRYGAIGKYQEALAENLEVLNLAPDDSGGYAILMGLYLALGRLDDAKKAYDEALSRKLESSVLHENGYDLAFLQNDSATMQKLVAGASGKSDEEDLLLSQQSDTEAYFGRFAQAREYSRRAVQSATHATEDVKESAAFWQAKAAVREAEVGNMTQARKEAQSAMALAPGLIVKYAAGLAFARAGDSTEARKIADQLDKEFPQGTVVQKFYLPIFRASLLLHDHDPAGAIRELEPTEPYELGANRTMYPDYVRGSAYLMEGKGKEAQVEFRKILDHPGVVCNFILGSLARLQLGRAQAMSGDKDAARASYQQFLTLWKDADPDLPILQEAKAEYAKLQP
ncbi:MAG TPA: winged helix-turn-helix domain-containing protein [Terriglobales bacterium]|nr:winged helix-turn-helix domain-containing protein [Terriglobales bacterium]